MRRDEVTILVVEDEEIIRLMFQQTFESWGFKVDVAENGKDALEMCHQKKYQIVVTDLNMPVMDGMELLKRLKSKWPNIEVMVITGYATIESAIEAMKLGAYDFILKPVNFDHVQFTMNKCYSKIRAEAENQELRQANMQLLELNEMKDKFLYITNHEIRTPLTIIKGYIDVLKNLVQNPDEELSETMEILDETTEELNELVDRMHLLEALEHGKIMAKNELVDLKIVLTKVYREVAKLFKQRQIELKVVVDKKPLFIRGDYRQIQLVMRELLQNALKFTPDRGNVMVRLELRNDKVYYSVKDSGIGIPFDKQKVIFDRFYEIQEVVNHKTSKDEFMGGGLGIGLSMVKEIINTMNGDIELISEPRQGSLFKIILPITQPQFESGMASQDKDLSSKAG
ncbi:MAG: hybrid sensor histidine kinase/response regulator [Calditrichia bacterium]